MMKTTNKGKMKIGAIAALLVACGVFFAPEAASAFNFRFTGIQADPNMAGGFEYRYKLELAPGEFFVTADKLTLSSLDKVYNATVSAPASNFFIQPTFNFNQVTWTAFQGRLPSAVPTSLENFSVFSKAPPGTVNWSFNGIGNPTSGTTTGPAPVPEPMTTLLASTVALGFGGWLKREQSKLQQKLKDKATT